MKLNPKEYPKQLGAIPMSGVILEIYEMLRKTDFDVTVFVDKGGRLVIVERDKQ